MDGDSLLARDLDHEPHVRRGDDFVVQRPFREYVPFLRLATVDGDSRFRVLIFALLQVAEHLLKINVR